MLLTEENNVFGIPVALGILAAIVGWSTARSVRRERVVAPWYETYQRHEAPSWFWTLIGFYAFFTALLAIGALIAVAQHA